MCDEMDPSVSVVLWVCVAGSRVDEALAYIEWVLLTAACARPDALAYVPLRLTVFCFSIFEGSYVFTSFLSILGVFVKRHAGDHDGSLYQMSHIFRSAFLRSGLRLTHSPAIRQPILESLQSCIWYHNHNTSIWHRVGRYQQRHLSITQAPTA